MLRNTAGDHGLSDLCPKGYRSKSFYTKIMWRVILLESSSPKGNEVFYGLAVPRVEN